MNVLIFYYNNIIIAEHQLRAGDTIDYAILIDASG